MDPHHVAIKALVAKMPDAGDDMGEGDGSGDEDAGLSAMEDLCTALGISAAKAKAAYPAFKELVHSCMSDAPDEGADEDMGEGDEPEGE